MNKKVLFGALAAAVVLVTAAISGAVYAQTPQPSPSGQGGQAQASRQSRWDSFLNQLAQNLHIDRPALDNAMKATAKQQVESAVSSGRLTRDQANQIEQRIDSGQFGPRFGGFGRGGGGRGGPGGGAAAACGADARQAVLSTLGVTADQIRQARQSGQTIDQIAQAHGKTAQDLQTAETNALKGCLDKQVQSGALTQQQEQDILQRVQQHGAGFRGFRPGNRGGTGTGSGR